MLFCEVSYDMKINFELLITLLVLIIPLLIFWILYQRGFYKWKLRTENKFKRKQKEREDAELEKEMDKQAKVCQGNPILEKLASRYNVIFCGGLGCGKTLVANLLVKYIHDKHELQNYKNRRMLRYTNPQYVFELEKLIEEQKLNVYSDIRFEDPDTGFTAHELWPYLTQQKKTIENGIYFADEIGTKLGKDQHQKQLAEKDPQYIAAAETARFARQDTNTVFIGTEQDEENIWKPIREKGFLAVKMHGVKTWLMKRGKVFKKIKNFWLNVMPGLLTLNVAEVLAIEFERKNKFKAFLKLLLPAYFLTPKPYYIKRIEIAKKIKFKYTKFKAFLEFEGNFNYLIFTNKDIYQYNTRGHREIYNSRFDENGNRKYA